MTKSIEDKTETKSSKVARIERLMSRISVNQSVKKATRTFLSTVGQENKQTEKSIMKM